MAATTQEEDPLCGVPCPQPEPRSSRHPTPASRPGLTLCGHPPSPAPKTPTPGPPAATVGDTFSSAHSSLCLKRISPPGREYETHLTWRLPGARSQHRVQMSSLLPTERVTLRMSPAPALVSSSVKWAKQGNPAPRAPGTKAADRAAHCQARGRNSQLVTTGPGALPALVPAVGACTELGTQKVLSKGSPNFSTRGGDLGGPGGPVMQAP